MAFISRNINNVNDFGLTINGPSANAGAIFLASANTAFAQGYNTSPSANGVIGVQASDAEDNDTYGYAVAIGNGKVVSGAFLEDTGGPNRGKVYTYDYSGSNENSWQSSDVADGDYFGLDVCVAGNRIWVGAYLEDTNSSSAGSVYVYDMDGSNEQIIRAPNQDVTLGGGYFGFSIDGGNGRVAVGAYNHYSANTLGSNLNAGSVYVFDYDGNMITHILPTDQIESSAASSGQFGRAVAVGSGRIVVGSPGEDFGNIVPSVSNQGSAYIYDLNGHLIKKISTPSEGVGVSNFDFGEGVAVGCNRIGVATYRRVGSGQSAQYFSSVYLYDIDGTFLKKIVPPGGEQDDDNFGTLKSMDIGHGVIAIGAFGRDSFKGQVFLYDLDGNLVQTLSEGNSSNNNFGASVEIKDGKLVVGAYYDDTGGSNRGKIYIYDLNVGFAKGLFDIDTY